jgi:hypothetical protein
MARFGFATFSTSWIGAAKRKQILPLHYVQGHDNAVFILLTSLRNRRADLLTVVLLALSR